MSAAITAAEATTILGDLARGRDGSGGDVWPLYERAEDAMVEVVALTARADAAEQECARLRGSAIYAEHLALVDQRFTVGLDAAGATRLTEVREDIDRLEALQRVDTLAEECARLRYALADNDLILEERERQLTAACKRESELRTILAGRTTPPTSEELYAHAPRGAWLVSYEDRYGERDRKVLYHLPHGLCALKEEIDILAVSGARWWALDGRGAPCAWPEVTR